MCKKHSPSLRVFAVGQKRGCIHHADMTDIFLVPIWGLIYWPGCANFSLNIRFRKARAGESTREEVYGVLWCHFSFLIQNRICMPWNELNSVQ